MQKVQVALANPAHASRLRKALARNGAWDVTEVDLPDLTYPGVIVLDESAFGRLPEGLWRPERIVLITRNETQSLRRAWEAGIVSVVFDTDPPDTAVLAVLAAELRVAVPALPPRGKRPPELPPIKTVQG
ncbi:MAG: hypothetical protein IPM24_18950 [Bryobacterales bacterium]|nr:hypothetical protein [Bryobacterales bacterium]